MNWLEVGLSYQRYESFHSCFGARDIIDWSEFPNIPENWKSKKKIKEKKRQIRKKRKEISNFKIL